MDKLLEDEINKNLSQMPDWQRIGDAISREFIFSDFTEAFDFMKALAPKIDKQNHHPDWSNSYNKLTISFTSHESGGLTQKDFDMARLVNLTHEAF